MARRPRTRSARSLDRAVLARAFGFLGPVEAVASLAMLPVGATLFVGWHRGTPCRPTGRRWPRCRPWCSRPSCWARWATPSSAAAPGCRCGPSVRPATACWWGRSLSRAWPLLGVVYLEPMQALLGERPLTLAQWLAVLAAPVLLFAAEEVRKTVIRRYRRLVAGPTGPATAGQWTLRRRAAPA